MWTNSTQTKAASIAILALVQYHFCAPFQLILRIQRNSLGENMQNIIILHLLNGQKYCKSTILIIYIPVGLFVGDTDGRAWCGHKTGQKHFHQQK